jgi:hypothetical protein
VNVGSCAPAWPILLLRCVRGGPDVNQIGFQSGDPEITLLTLMQHFCIMRRKTASLLCSARRLAVLFNERGRATPSPVFSVPHLKRTKPACARKLKDAPFFSSSFSDRETTTSHATQQAVTGCSSALHAALLRSLTAGTACSTTRKTWTRNSAAATSSKTQ